jgi:hypothetical protein
MSHEILLTLRVAEANFVIINNREYLPISPSVICNAEVFRICNLLVSPTFVYLLDQILVMHKPN